MEYALMVIVLLSVFSLILFLLLISSPHSDQTYAHKLAKIHIPVNDHRHSIPPDDDRDNASLPEWALLAAALFLLIMLINAAS